MQAAVTAALIEGLLVSNGHPAVAAVACKIGRSDTAILATMLLGSPVASRALPAALAVLRLHQSLRLLLECGEGWACVL